MGRSRVRIPLSAKDFFLEFFNRGLFVEKKSNQFYDEKAKMFLPDRYVEGTCPKCGNDQARTLVLVDDIPLNKSDAGSVNWNLINRDNVEKIEILTSTPLRH